MQNNRSHSALILLSVSLFFSVFTTTLHAQNSEAPFIAKVTNLTHPGNTLEIEKTDIIEIEWQLNPDSPFAKEHSPVQVVKSSEIGLLAQVKPGAPTKMVILNPGNNPLQLTTRFRISDFEYRLPLQSAPEYGSEWQSDTKLYIHFKDLLVVDADGNEEKVEIGERDLYIGFKLK